MYSESMIRAEGLGKSYTIYERPSHRLIELLGGRAKAKHFWALRNIDLDIRRGETIGIVGRNGSGKSTLLQIIAGTLPATEGRVQVGGKVAALLELGSGFNPEFTGRENVYLNASLLGLSRDEVDARLPEILEFADIGDFVNQPVRAYSSGMVMRLAFAVIAHVDADILIVDEALAVGDAFFTQKCMRFLRAFQQRGTLLFVSHDTAAVTGLCDRAVWLDHGQLKMEGDARMVSDAYLEAFVADRERSKQVAVDARPVFPRQEILRDMREEIFERTTLRNDVRVLEFDPHGASFGNQTARIIDVSLLDSNGKLLRSIIGGELVTLEVVAEASVDFEAPIVGFYFKDRLGQLLFGDNTYLATGGSVSRLMAGDRYVGRFQFQMPRLQQGDYFITAGLACGSQDDHVVQQWMHEALSIKAEGQGLPVGIIGLPMTSISLETVQ